MFLALSLRVLRKAKRKMNFDNDFAKLYNILKHLNIS